MQLEICVDNHESLVTAIASGADRIELCAGLREGGLTPSWAFTEAALLTSPVPVFIMIRPRSCDFLYSPAELEMMHRDIHAARKLGAPGVVFGVLTAGGEIDAEAMRSLVAEAAGMQVTCHRAADQVRDIFAAIDLLADLGVHRILTSGQEETPFAGMHTLARMTAHADRRIKIMAAGVTSHDVGEIIRRTGVTEVHSAAMRTRTSRMEFVSADAKMGHGDDFSLGVTDGDEVRAIKAKMPSA